MPAIELEKKESLINLTTAAKVDAQSVEIRQKAAYILNRNYEEYNEHTNSKKTFIGLKLNEVSYSSLSMGAGEQRVFKILETIYKAPDYSLIIIDEIDLTLHTEALNKLIDILTERSERKKLQIIFTSHREELVKRDDLNIRHILQTPTKTLCFNKTNPDCITRLTGRPTREIEIFVEDDLGEAISRKVTEELFIHRHCSIKRFGAATNSFSLAMAMNLKGEPTENIGVFLDGDVYRTHEEKIAGIRSVYSGNEADADQRRLNAISCIYQFDLPGGMQPEAYINSSIRKLNDKSEIVNVALGINGVRDKHEYVQRILEILGYQKDHGLSKVIDKLSETPEWITYTQPLRDWLRLKIAALHIVPN